jgi:hypothetical protein
MRRPRAAPRRIGTRGDEDPRTTALLCNVREPDPFRVTPMKQQLECHHRLWLEWRAVNDAMQFAHEESRETTQPACSRAGPELGLTVNFRAWSQGEIGIAPSHSWPHGRAPCYRWRMRSGVDVWWLG